MVTDAPAGENVQPGMVFVNLDREAKRPDKPPSPTLDREFTTNIVAAYVRRNQVGADQLGN